VEGVEEGEGEVLDLEEGQRAVHLGELIIKGLPI